MSAIENIPAVDNGLLRFLTCGSVDDGKSTLIGRLLYDTRMIYEDQLAAVMKDSLVHGTTGTDFDRPCSPTDSRPNANRASPSTSPTATSPRPSGNSSSPTPPAIFSTPGTWSPGPRPPNW